MESNLQAIRDNLRKFFRILSERALELFFKNVELEEISKIKSESYVSDSILESMVKLKEGVSLFVSFFSDYIKAATLGYILFCDLIRALGYQDFLSVLFRQVELDEVIDYSKIDVDFFKFQVRTALDLYLQDARFELLSTYRKARGLPKVVDYTRSEFAKRLIQVMEKQNEDWLKILDEIYSYYENVLLKGNLEEMVRGLKNIIRYFIEMAERLQIVQEFIIPHKSWKELILQDIQKLGERIEEIKEEILIISNYRIKCFEHGFNASLFLLRMLWGSEEVALKKLEGFSNSQLSIEEVLPKGFRLEDLAFGLMGAVEQFNMVKQAIEVLKEKINVLAEAANILGSQAVQNLYKETVDAIKWQESIGEEIYETLLTIQDLTEKALGKQ